LLIVGAIYAAAMIAVAAYRARAPYTKGVGTSDYVPFYVTARHFIETGQITSDAGVRNYLPFFTVLMAPLAVLPCWLGAGIMTAMSIPALLLSVAMIGRALVPAHRPSPITTTVVPVLMILPFVHACLVLGQLSILIGLLCLLTWWLVGMERPWAAGVPLAVAVLVKPFLVTLVVFLALKRQWRAVLATLGWAGLLGGAMTLAAMGPESWLDAHRNYYQQVLRRQTPLAQFEVAELRAARYSNQSLSMVIRRLLSDVQAGTRRKPFQVNLASLPPRAMQAVYVAVMLAISVVTIAVGRHPAARTEPQRAHFEFAMFLVWGLFGSPIVWTHYYPLLLYPVVLLTVQRIRDGQAGRPNRLGRVAWWFWIAAAASLVTEAVTLPYLRAVGVHLWATMLVWAAMAVCAHRVPTTHGDPSAPRPSGNGPHD